MQTKETI